MYELYPFNWIDSCLVSIGAVFGSCLRFKILSCSLFAGKVRYLGTFSVNFIATFFLGTLFPFIAKCQPNCFNQPVFLFFSIGFLGSLSTFSTLIIDILDNFLDRSFKKALLISIFSIVGGVLALALGHGFASI